MAKTIVVCGYGPKISDGVARRFGREGFQVALVARSADKLERAAAELKRAGVTAQGFSCDLSNVDAVRKLFSQLRADWGPVTVLHWNAHSHAAGDLTTAEPAALHENFDVAATSLMVAVQTALPDLRAAGSDGAVLVTGGRLSEYNERGDALAVQWGVMGLAVAKAAQRKLVGLLHARLKSEGIFVGEVTVGAVVKGTRVPNAEGTLDPAEVAECFWQLYRERSAPIAHIP